MQVSVSTIKVLVSVWKLRPRPQNRLDLALPLHIWPRPASAQNIWPRSGLGLSGLGLVLVLGRAGLGLVLGLGHFQTPGLGLVLDLGRADLGLVLGLG